MLSHLHFSDPVVFDVDSSCCTEGHGPGHGPTSATTIAHARSTPATLSYRLVGALEDPSVANQRPLEWPVLPKALDAGVSGLQQTSPEVVRAVLGAQRPCPAVRTQKSRAPASVSRPRSIGSKRMACWNTWPGRSLWHGNRALEALRRPWILCPRWRLSASRLRDLARTTLAIILTHAGPLGSSQL